MSRYTGPKGRVNRALGVAVYEKAGAVRALERRDTPPGMHGNRQGKKSEYGLAMLEKKKLKHYYGLHERQLKRFFELASRSTQNTGEELLVLCERRLDNVIRRAGFARTRQQARQGVHHGHFRVNGQKVDVASYLVSVHDVIAVAPKPHLMNLYREIIPSTAGIQPDWVIFDGTNLRVTITRLPIAAEIAFPLEMNRIIELLTR